VYLAREFIRGKSYYFIRESYQDNDCLRNRELFALGTDPAHYIKYPGGNSYYIDEVVEDTLAEYGLTPTGDELDDIFWDFLKPDIRYKLEPFRRKELRSRQSRSIPVDVDMDAGAQHLFDKYRLFYLKTGQKNMNYVHGVPAKMFRALFGKSRDELEQQFIAMERILSVRELKTYVYTVFDLQKHFSEHFAKAIPDFLDQLRVDEHFIREICALNDDEVFWSGFDAINNGLNDYLVRYLIMFFDHDYEPRSFMDEYIRRFMNDRRDYRPPTPKATVSIQEASDIFGEGKETLKKMNRKELSRLYRRRARRLHPDAGGDSKAFIRLTRAYKSLMRRGH
jgi:hypothetical protein